MASPAPPKQADEAAVDLRDSQWAPFIRHDRWGTYGSLPQPFLVRLRLFLLALTLLPVRIILALVCIIGLSWSTRLCFLLPKGSAIRFRVVAVVSRFWAGLCCVFLGLRRTWVVLPPSAADKAQGHGSQPPAGIVSNHLSWADILILESRLAPSFVSKDGAQRLPFLGLVNQETQCIYVKRDEARLPGTPGQAEGIKTRMARKAADPQGTVLERPVLVFPEGTCTNGRFLIKFKTGAFLAGVPLLPVLMVWDEPSHRRRVSVAWDSIDLPWHIVLALTEPHQHVTCYELPVYVPNEAEKKDPVLYATNMRNYMLKYCSLLPSDSTYETKRVFDRLPRSLFNKPLG